ncbi:Rad9 [Fragilaria crotonensis]|nr:Rad9 [Fragilaria crotonensis]
MDCTIPHQNVRTFCSAISAMSKIGKDLYIEFDPLDGLIVRTLNDAKSAFCAFYWKPSFFERCTAPPLRKRSQDEQVFKCRISMRAMAPIMKPRKGVASLRIRNEASSDQLYLSFHFQLEKNNDTLSVVHRIGVVDAEGVHAVTDRKGSSEISALPRFLLRMMEPLKKASEIALTVNDKTKIVTMASHHHESQHHGNIILQSKSATQLKSETSAGADEFEEYLFQDEHHYEKENDAPSNVKEEVTLVCTLREPKAMLQFCASAADDDLRVALLFHWGGKPLIFETKGSTFAAELVMATLDHSLLRPSNSHQHQ